MDVQPTVDPSDPVIPGLASPAPSDPLADVSTEPAAPPTSVPVYVPIGSEAGMQSIENIEQALVELLRGRPNLSPFQVEAWPEDVSKYKLRSRRGAILVSYKGSVFGKDASTDGVAQKWTMNFEIVTLCRNLRSHRGAYLVLDEIRMGITGWLPPAAIDNAYPTHEGFVGEEDGVWQYATYLSVPTINVSEDMGADPVLGNLQSITPFMESD